MEYALITIILATAIKSSTPLIFAGMGELITEKSGILNLGVEGVMLIGALVGFATAYTCDNLFLAVLIAALAGGVFSLLHAWATISFRGNQIVSGLTLVILGTGLSGYFGKKWIGEPAKMAFLSVPIPFLSKLPVLGTIFFSQNLLVYLSYLLAPTIIFLLYKTDWGLSVRACGENPAAADVMGISVTKIRYLCVFAGGMLMGIAGSYMSLAYTPMWGEKMTAGKGWIAIVLVIFAGWKPYRLILGAYLFGAIEALQLHMQASGKVSEVPVHFLMMLPYVFTIAILVVSSLRKKADEIPAALARPFQREAGD